jgi:exonuclease III
LYNNHLKSHFVPFGEDPVQGEKRANARRQRQAETVSRIISRMERPDSKYILLGDMNGPPDSPFLQPMQIADEVNLHNALVNVVAQKLDKAFIDRRTKHSGDGSDHDPAWISLDI